MYDFMCVLVLGGEGESLSPLWLFATLWTVAHQAPLSMGFPKQEYWNGFPFYFPRDPPNPRIKPTSPALAGGFFTTDLAGKSRAAVVTSGK